MKAANQKEALDRILAHHNAVNHFSVEYLDLDTNPENYHRAMADLSETLSDTELDEYDKCLTHGYSEGVICVTLGSEMQAGTIVYFYLDPTPEDVTCFYSFD